MKVFIVLREWSDHSGAAQVAGAYTTKAGADHALALLHDNIMGQATVHEVVLTRIEEEHGE